MKEEAKILIVDDDPAFVEVAIASLRTVPYRVEAAYNKEEGMKKIKKNKPDLVILDVIDLPPLTVPLVKLESTAIVSGPGGL